jgi:hypothetical protein
MRRLFAVVLFFLAGVPAFCACTITDSIPLLVPGQSVLFHTSGCTAPVTWSVSGVGTVSTSGLYTAPAIYHAPQYLRGCQVHPQNHWIYADYSALPTNSNSVTWMSRIQSMQFTADPPRGHAIILPSELYHTTIIHNTDPLVNLVFIYNPQSGFAGNYHIPFDRRYTRQQYGWDEDPQINGTDQHLFSVNWDNCNTEIPYRLTLAGITTPTSVVSDGGANTLLAYTASTIYPIYSPVQMYVKGGTGAWAGINNTSTGYTATVLSQNMQTGKVVLSIPFDSHQIIGPAASGIKIGSWIGDNWGSPHPEANVESASYWSPTNESNPNCNPTCGTGSGASGVPENSLVLNMQEWENALLACPTAPCTNDVGHSLGTVMTNYSIGDYSIWPATTGLNTLPTREPVLTGNTNANPTTITTSGDFSHWLPCTSGTPSSTYSWIYSAGCTFPLYITGSSCAAINGHVTATAVDNTHATLPVQGCGTETGAPIAFMDWMPYGAIVVLNSTYDATLTCTFNSWTAQQDECKLAEIFYNTIKKHGLVIRDGTGSTSSPDGTDNWDSGFIIDDFLTEAESNAYLGIANYNRHHTLQADNFDQQSHIVDPSSIQLTSSVTNPLWGGTSQHRIQVTATDATSSSASQDVFIQGTAVSVNPERISIAAPFGATSTTYQVNAKVFGSSNAGLTFSISPAITGVSVSGSGLITVDNTFVATTIQSAIVTISSAGDPTAPSGFLQVDIIPVAKTPNNIFLTFGQQNYTDVAGNVWQGTTISRSFQAWAPNPVLNHDRTLGSYNVTSWTWCPPSGCADRVLYNHSVNNEMDVVGRIAVPNGLYSITFYGEPGCYTVACTTASAPGNMTFDVEVQGAIVGPNADAYLMAGSQPSQGYSATYQAAVIDGVLEFAYRGRTGISTATTGISLSSVKISPITAPLAPVTIKGTVTLRGTIRF